MPQPDRQLADLQVKFREYYNQNLGSKFAKLEKIRRKNLRFFWKWLIIFTAIAMVVIRLCSDGIIPKEFYSGDVFGYGTAFYGIIVIITLYMPFSDYAVDTKMMVLEKVVSFFGDFKYKYGRSLPRSVVEKSALFGDFYRQYGDDYFEGSYNGVGIKISEEHLTSEYYTNKGKREKVIFDGVLIVLDMNKKFLGQTVVRHDWGMFNFLMQAPVCLIKKKNVKLFNVRLEDCVFEKQFEVFSSDQVEARYLLTTAFMERIMEVKRRFRGKKIQFSFFDNKLFIAVSTGKDMFETTSLFTTTARYGKMREVVSQFYSIFSIVDILKLDKRIGM